MSDESNIQALFSKTKYLIVDMLKIQKGETFTTIIHSPANLQQQVNWLEGWVGVNYSSD